MRLNFFLRRKKEKLSQYDLAQKLGYSPAYIGFIERGEKDGTQKFWATVKEVWDIPNAEMYDYMLNKE